jgi:hypothetical protein
MAVERDSCKTVETMFEEGSLSIKLLPNIMNLVEDDVLQIKRRF